MNDGMATKGKIYGHLVKKIHLTVILDSCVVGEINT
jgi:hypothetical protein